ncbi:hypothetical protein Pmani_019870 [Petrolisthes manimaculis]|uniref:Uncharacterized protein n=1 Tax=Petrolisthes manimaculis TaxID=1843537 RepID=A0AAE1U350_9EUCA|nr:hypothetical protein Pmani_019870 [Petrolisthes manimaculis]
MGAKRCLHSSLSTEWQPRREKVSQKRGFGSMMPAYLLQMYRAAHQPNLNPSDLFSSTRPISERGKIGYGTRRG